MIQYILDTKVAISSVASIFEEIFGILGAGGIVGNCTLMFGINDGNSGNCGGEGSIGIVGILRFANAHMFVLMLLRSINISN